MWNSLTRLIKPLRSRSLSSGEQAMIRSVFGDSIALDRVKLHEHRLVLKGYALSPNGQVYFHAGELPADFSAEPLARQAWLIHEMTHVWQVQQGTDVLLRALFDRRYRYRLSASKPFWLYGVEQQARMVEDWYIRRAKGLDCSALEKCLPFV